MRSLSAGISGEAASGGLSLRRRRGNYSNKVLSIATANLLAYWPLGELSGTTITDLSVNARHGTYTAVDLAQAGIGDGRTAPLWDGVNDYGNIYSTSLRDAFNSQEGTLAFWFKVASAGVWTDAAIRELVCLRVDTNNIVRVRRTASNGQLQFTYLAGATSKSITKTSANQTGWVHAAMTWSKAADQLNAYYNGALLSGSPQTALGTWAGLLANTNTLLGAGTTGPASIWNGYLAHVALWGVALNSSQIASLATL